MNKMDMLNLLEIMCQWEAIMAMSEKKMTQEFINLKLKLEQDILK